MHSRAGVRPGLTPYNKGDITMTVEQLRESLVFAPKNGYASLSPAQRHVLFGRALQEVLYMSTTK